MKAPEMKLVSEEKEFDANEGFDILNNAIKKKGGYILLTITEEPAENGCSCGECEKVNHCAVVVNGLDPFETALAIKALLDQVPQSARSALAAMCIPDMMKKMSDTK